MKKIFSVIISVILTASLVAAFFIPAVFADDTAQFVMSVDKTNPHPTEKVTLTLSLKNISQYTDGIANIDAVINFDADNLTLDESKGIKLNSDVEANCAISNVDVSENKIIISLAADAPEKLIPSSISTLLTATFTVKETAPENTVCEFSFGDFDNDFTLGVWKPAENSGELGEGEEVDFTLGSSVNVTVGKKLDTDATLKSLSVEGYQLNRTFKPTRTSYSIAVPYDVTSVTVKYELTSETATAKLTNKKLAVGANTVKIVVTAEDGVSKKTYTVTVTRQEEPVTSKDDSEVTSETSETSDTPSDTPDSSDEPLPSDDSSQTEPLPSDDPSSSHTDTDDSRYVQLQSQVEQYKKDNLLLKDKISSIVIIFAVLTVVLLGVMIFIAISYKRDMK